MPDRRMRSDNQSFFELGEAMVRGESEHPPVAQLVGFKLAALERGKSTMILEAGPQHANPMGTLHGGILCDVADAAMGMAFGSTLEPDETMTTLELKINFMKTVWDGELQAVGRVVKRGRTIGLLECDIMDENGSLVARASSSCMVLRGERAEGR